MAISHLGELVGRVLADRYRIVAPLGRGAAGRVYLADDTHLRRRVAVKMLHEGFSEDAAFLKRFKAEARAAAALNHPNVMHVYDSGADGGAPYLICEYLGGGSLRALLDAGHRLTPSQALLVGLECARGLDYAHRHGVVHRDIKPANLLFGDDGRLRIADFGLARAIAEAAWTEPEGMLLGTARYASPEQAQGRQVDGKSDVYALALVLCEAVTGVVPFVGDTTTSTLMARCRADLQPPAVLGQLGKVVERAGRLDPSDRPDAGGLEVALMAAAEDLPRPKPLPLVGAVDPDISARPVDDTIHPPVAPADDLTDVLPLAGREDGDGAAFTNEPAEPERRRRWRRVVALLTLLTVAAGSVALAYLLVRTPEHRVPDLAGATLAEAKDATRRYKWRLDTAFVRKDGTKPDDVVGQRPRPGASLAEGRTLRLDVSLGNTLVTLPALAGQPRAAVEAQLAEIQIAVGTVSAVNDEQVSAGTVMEVKAAVDQAGQLPRGSTVDLVVSAGPAPRTIPPGLAGQRVEVARKALGDLGLKVSEVQEFDDSPVGTVLALSQADGAQVPRDSTVEVKVSKGPAPVPIPDVAGRSVADATAELSRAGFVVSGVEGSPAGAVLASDPPAGEAHVPGTAVRLFTRR